MKKIELGFSALCFLLALIAVALIAHDDVTLGFRVAWGGSALVTVAYAALLLLRRRIKSGAGDAEHPRKIVRRDFRNTVDLYLDRLVSN